jgi:hypothetical protein
MPTMPTVRLRSVALVSAFGLRKFPHRAQQQCNRCVGDFLGQYFGRVGHDDAARRRRFGIDMVVADAEARNDLQLRKAFHERLAEQFSRGGAGDRPDIGM